MNAKDLLYNKRKTPLQNINTFFDAVNSPLYEWTEVKIEKKFKYYLASAWNGAGGLKDITLKFQKEFCEHLIEISMSEKLAKDYMHLLKKCKAKLQNIDHYYKPSGTNIRIVTRVLNAKNELGIVTFETLPDSAQDLITTCHELFILFFRQLQESINEEMKDFERAQYVMKESSYQWIGDKNAFSELTLAVFAQGDFKMKGNKKMMPNTFAREFAAFFGIHELNFRQDIENLRSRSKRKPGEFIDKCKGAFLKYLQIDIAKK